MEISPTARQEQYDSPSKHSSRTIKPADRCVISYNFEQNNSHNYTHNLLIGMGHEECKKSAKKSVNTSVEHCKSKIAHIWKSNEKSFKHYPEVIAKTYQSNVVANMLNQAQSPRKSSQRSKENVSFRDHSQENGHQGSRFQPLNHESYFQKQNGDVTLPEGSFMTNPLKEEFNQEEERKKSPYYSKFQYQKEKKIGAKRSKDFSNQGENIDERDHSRSRDSGQNTASKQGKKVMNMITNTLKTKHEGSKVQSNNNTTYNHSSSIMKKYNPLAQSLKGFLYVPGAKVDKSSRMNSFNIKKKENNSKNKSQFSKSKTNHSEEDITQNNVIKGFKMPPWKIEHQISPLAPKNNQQNKASNQQNKRKPQVLLNPVVSDTKLKKTSQFNSAQIISGKNHAQSHNHITEQKAGSRNNRSVEKSSIYENSKSQKASSRHNRSGEKEQNTSLYKKAGSRHNKSLEKEQRESFYQNSKSPKATSRQNTSLDKEKKSSQYQNSRSQRAGSKLNKSSEKEQKSSRCHNSKSQRSEISQRGSDRVDEKSNLMRNSENSSLSPYDKTARTVKRNKSKQKSNESVHSKRKNSIDQRTESKKNHENGAIVACSPVRPTIPKISQEKNYKMKNWRESSSQKRKTKESWKPFSNSNKKIQTQFLHDEKECKFSKRSEKRNSIEQRRQSRKNNENGVIMAYSPPKPTIPRLSQEKNRKFKNWKDAQTSNQKAKDPWKPVSTSNKKIQSQSNEEKHSRFSKRSEKKNSTDLDAQEEDKFGLRAQKNVASNKIKTNKRDSSKKSPLGNKKVQSATNDKEIIEESEQNNEVSFDNKMRQQKQKGQTTTGNEQNGGGAVILQGETPLPNQKGPGVQKIQQLIDQNGSLSSINDSYEESKMNSDRKEQKNQEQKSKRHSQHITPIITPGIMPNNQKNLEELIKATEEVHPHQKELEPILNEVEMELDKQQSSKIDIHESAASGNKGEDLNAMAVNLPVPEIDQGDRLDPKQTPIPENETDYHEEYMDKMGDMLPPEQHTKSEDFFQCNLNEKSKVSFSAVNNTKYQNVDKDTSNYTRAPILSFLYQIPKKSYSKNVPFEPSTCINQITKKIEKSLQIDDAVIDEAVSILLSIDPWIIERILEPFEDKDGKTGIWLYCHGQWTLFLENKQQSFRFALKSAVEKGLNKIGEPYLLEPALKLISGVRIMRLKGSKKRIFSELEYSLKKGHILKVLTSKQSKWGNKMFQVTKVQVANDNQNLVQIKYDNDKYWIKEEKFKELFEHFLLICARQSHFWTHRLLEHKDDQKIVVNLTSDVPTHGSITIFYPSNKPSSLLLYKQFDAGMLKYIGMIEEKPNQNGNLYFQFKLHGNYSLFLQTPTSCLLAIESTSPLEIGAPEYIQSESLKNRECEYVELKRDREKVRETRLKESRLRQTRLRDTKLRETSGSKRDESLEIIKEIFINMVVKK